MSLSADETVDPRDERDHIAESETAMLVDRALLRLSAEQRAAIVAVDMEGYSVAEAAARLGVPEGTVRVAAAHGPSWRDIWNTCEM